MTGCVTRRCQRGARRGAALGRRGRGRDGVRNRRRRAGRRIFARRIPDAARAMNPRGACRSNRDSIDEDAHVPPSPPLARARSRSPRSPRSPARPALPAARRTPQRTRAPHGRPRRTPRRRPSTSPRRRRAASASCRWTACRCARPRTNRGSSGMAASKASITARATHTCSRSPHTGRRIRPPTARRFAGCSSASSGGSRAKQDGAQRSAKRTHERCVRDT